VSIRNRRLSLVMAAVAAALLVAAGMAVHRERERRQVENLVASGRAALSARVPGRAQCAAVVDWLLPRLVSQGEGAAETAWQVVADCAMLAGRWEQAVTAWRTLADRAPRELGPQLGLSRALAQAGQHAAALEAARRAVGLEPQSWRAKRALGLAAAAGGDIEAAIAALEQARALAPGHEQATLARQLDDVIARRVTPPAGVGAGGRTAR
jgi:tetratricopeptide (TPR) repeat protein